MKRILKKILLSSVSLIVIAGLLSACGSNNKTAAVDSDKKTLKIGVSAGPYNVLFDDAIEPILEKQGYTIEHVDFQDLLQSAIALNNDEIDFIVAQHTAWIDNFNETQNGRMVSITPIPTVPAGIFSATNTSIDQISDGAKIAIPNDASNTARAYALLQKAGWIQLKDDIDLMTASSNDVIDNPHNLEFVEMESLNIPRSLEDFDYAVITGSIVYNAGIDPSTALLQEDISPYLILVAGVNEENADTQWAKDIASAYHSDEFKAYMKEHNQNNLWYIPEELQ